MASTSNNMKNLFDYSCRVDSILRELTEGAEQLGNGALDHRLPVRGGDEIAHLATSFNAMADSLQARNRELLRKELYIEKMLDPMWVLDAENRVKDVNPAFTELFGHRRDEAIGRPSREAFEGRDLAVFDTHAKRRHARGLADVYELAVRRGGGGKVPVLISCSPIAESGGLTGTIGVCKDISSRKELEEDLFQKNRELYALNTIAAITSHSLDMDEVLKNVVGEVLSFMHMDAGGIYVVDDVKKEIACVSHTGVPKSVANRMQTYRFGENIPGTVAVSGATVAVSNIAADARTRDRSLAGMGMKGYHAVEPEHAAAHRRIDGALDEGLRADAGGDQREAADEDADNRRPVIRRRGEAQHRDGDEEGVA